MLRVGSYPHILHGDNALGHLLMAARDKFVFDGTMPVRDALRAREANINGTHARTELLHATVRDDSALLLQIPPSVISSATSALPRLQSRDKGRHLNACVGKLPGDVLAWVSETASPWRYLFASQRDGRLSMLFVRLVPKSVRTESALRFPGQVVLPMPDCQDDDLASEADWVVMNEPDDDATVQEVRAVVRQTRHFVDISSSFDHIDSNSREVRVLQPRRKRKRLTRSV